MAEAGHNSNEQLRSIVDRIENIETSIKEHQQDRSDIYAEAKGNGYCPKTLRKIIALRKKDPDARAEENALMETYLAALGMDA